ncbi:hypothetical protein T492DRAFT_964225 [Pavlovales sp. CCMP2436]|nr:hypothetical protein T492DRAFT_964225 [Pavlovales sp. CCMP2436]
MQTRRPSLAPPPNVSRSASPRPTWSTAQRLSPALARTPSDKNLNHEPRSTAQRPGSALTRTQSSSTGLGREPWSTAQRPAPALTRSPSVNNLNREPRSTAQRPGSALARTPSVSNLNREPGSITQRPGSTLTRTPSSGGGLGREPWSTAQRPGSALARTPSSGGGPGSEQPPSRSPMPSRGRSPMPSRGRSPMPSSRDTGYRIAHVNYREADADTLLPPVQKCAFEVPISSARYEVTGDLEIDTDVGCEAHSVLHAVDPTVQHADAESQTDHVPGFGEVAPEVSAKNVLKLLNRARCNPKSMAGLLERRALLVDATDRIEKADRVFLQLAEGRKAVDNCIRVMLLATPVPELTLSAELTRAAQDHVEDLGPKGLTGHTGSAGDSTWKRVARHCEWRVHCAENIDYMSTSAPEIVLSMLVDDDVPSRGHRKMILKSDFTKVNMQ